MIELQYLHALMAIKLRAARTWAIWQLVPAGVTAIQMYRSGPAVATGDDLRLSTSPTTLYRP